MGESDMSFTMVKVFSATMARERAKLGEDITLWLVDHKQLEVVNTVVKQSSDAEYHCLSIILFLRKSDG